MDSIQTKALAELLKTINEKLDVLIKEQENIKADVLKNRKVIMKRLQKLEEYNDIDEMRNVVLNDHIDKIAKVTLELEKEYTKQEIRF